MVRSNQPPKLQCCRVEGQDQASGQEAESRTTTWRRTQGDSQAASESRTSLKQSSPETTLQLAGGDAVASAEPNMEMSARRNANQSVQSDPGRPRGPCAGGRGLEKEIVAPREASSHEHHSRPLALSRPMVGFVDGHVRYIKIYWNASRRDIFALDYEPPAGYDYKWSAD